MSKATLSRHRAIARGECPQCGGPADPSKYSCQKCRRARAVRVRARKDKMVPTVVMTALLMVAVLRFAYESGYIDRDNELAAKERKAS